MKPSENELVLLTMRVNGLVDPNRGLTFRQLMELLELSISAYINANPNYYAANTPPIPGLRVSTTSQDGVFWHLEKWDAFETWCLEHHVSRGLLARIKEARVERALNRTQ